MPPKRLRAAKIPPHVGYKHRIYSIRSGDGSDIKYSTIWKEGCKLESYIEIYLRDGNSLNAQKDFTTAPVSVELERVRQRVIESYDVYQNKSHDQFVSKLSIVECFYLELLPDSLFSKYLVILKQRLIYAGEDLFTGNSAHHHVPFGSLSEIEFIAFMEYLLTDKEKETSFGIKGRGVGYKSLEGFVTVVRSIHRAAGIPEGICPTYGETAKAMIKNCFDRYHPEGAPTLDMATFLPSAHVALGTSDIPDFDKVMRWAMLLISINIFARASEITSYCPLAEDIVFPADSEDWSPDGIPRYIKLKLTWWKSRKKLQPVYYIIWRNYINTIYCPVFNLLLWLRVSKIEQGPIFVKLKGDKLHRDCCKAEQYITKCTGSVNYKVWVDADGKEVNLNYESWNEICKMFFNGANVSEASTHSIRKSAAVWAARCGAEEYQIREAGRWNAGDTYLVYVKSGKELAALANSRKDGSMDPIRKIWVFHPTAFLTTLS